VTIVILLVLVGALWVVMLVPSIIRRRSEHGGTGSIDHFHHQLQLLEHAGPKFVAPAYRLHTAVPGGDSSLAPVDPNSSRPKLVLLRPVEDEDEADIDGLDGCHYERVGVLDHQDPGISPAQARAELGAYRRQMARQRCTFMLRILTLITISTALLGILPVLHLIWILTALTGLADLGLMGLIAYAREVELQRERRREGLYDRSHHTSEYDEADGYEYQDDPGYASAGYPGAWDEEYHEPRQAAGGR
jgi:hypothetical protein